MTIRDYRCKPGNPGIDEKITAGLSLEFPDAYKHWETMSLLAKAIKSYGSEPFCTLPFCHTVEAEAMGAIINYGDERFGPRTGAYRCNGVEELLKLPDLEFREGRIHEVLLACKHLRQEGEEVVLQVTGPFTTLDALIDHKYVFRALKKQPELMKEIFWKMGTQIIRYIKEAQKQDVHLISYADSSGGVNILGPKFAEQVVNDFTYEFMKTLKTQTREDTLIILCPKTTYALIGTGKAVLEEVDAKLPDTYGEACIFMVGKAKFVGHTCIQNCTKKLAGGKMRSVKLL